MRRKLWLLQLVVVLTGLMVSQTASAALIVRKISGVMPAFGDVSIDAPAAPHFSRNGTYMVYVADQRVDAMFELFRAPVYSNEPRTLLSVGLPPGGAVEAFTMASNRQELVYLVDTGPGSSAATWKTPGAWTDFGSAPQAPWSPMAPTRKSKTRLSSMWPTTSPKSTCRWCCGSSENPTAQRLTFCTGCCRLWLGGDRLGFASSSTISR